MVALHHEQPDGKGYPRQVKEGGLDKFSRMLAIVAKYDEITHALFDNLGMMPAKAMKHLFKEAINGKFDQKLVSSFIHLIGVYPIGSAVKLTNQSKGVIVHHQPDSPLKPQVMLYYGEDGKALKTPQLLNTSNIEGLEIEGFVDPNDKASDPNGLLSMTEAAAA
jgi:hypothetical protein